MSLVTKLAAVMQAIERIPKRGRNDFHKYDYATEADIVSAIRSELATRQVMLIPAITGMQRDPVGEKGSVLTTLTMEFTFMDGESNETIVRPWIGAGTDKEDKGAYKAMTGGEKYFLLKTFLIPTGDDPEVHDVKESKPPARETSAIPSARERENPPARSGGAIPGTPRFQQPVKRATPIGVPPTADVPPLTDADIPFARGR